jgi:hypothetical protein
MKTEIAEKEQFVRERINALNRSPNRTWIRFRSQGSQFCRKRLLECSYCHSGRIAGCAAPVAASKTALSGSPG